MHSKAPRSCTARRLHSHNSETVPYSSVLLPSLFSSSTETNVGQQKEHKCINKGAPKYYDSRLKFLAPAITKGKDDVFEKYQSKWLPFYNNWRVFLKFWKGLYL